MPKLLVLIAVGLLGNVIARFQVGIVRSSYYSNDLRLLDPQCHTTFPGHIAARTIPPETNTNIKVRNHI